VTLKEELAKKLIPAEAKNKKEVCMRVAKLVKK
jgi:hypothetical protein